MKRYLVSALAVAAFAIGGSAQADVIDSVGNTLSRILGIPYNPGPTAVAPIGYIHYDASGRRFHLDAAGRLVPLDQYGSYRDQWGRTVYLGANHQPLYVEQNGRLLPFHGTTGTYALGPSYDQDGDTVADAYDRAPYDPRYR